MKLKAYSNNNAIRHFAFHTLKNCFWLPIVNFVLSVFVFIVSEIVMEDRSITMLLHSKLDADFAFNNTDIWYLFPYFLIALSIFSALASFAFMFKKKSATMYMLIGVSRSQLFFVRYLFGLISQVLPITLCYFILHFIGASNIDKSFVLNSEVLVVLAMLIAITVFSYTVCVIAVTLCGKILEYCISSVAFLFAAQGLMFTAFMLSASFLHGNMFSIRDVDQLPLYMSDLLEKYSAFSVNSIFSEHLAIYPFLCRNYPEFIMPEYKLKLALLLASGLVLIPVAQYLFKKRSSEINGKASNNKPLTAFCAVITSLPLSALLLYIKGSLLMLALMVAVFLAGCVAVHVIMNASVKGLTKSFAYSAPTAVLICVAVFILFTGGLGYSSTIPDIDNVESAVVCYNGNMEIVNYSGASRYGFLLESYEPTLSKLPVLTEKEDIEKVLKIHEAIIKDGSLTATGDNPNNSSDTVVYADYYIKYALKDGTELIRYYPVMKLSTLYQTLLIEDTEAYESYMFDNLSGKNGGISSIQMIDENTKLALSDNMLANVTPLELTKQQKDELTEALAKDRKNATFEEIYHPKEECVGVLFLMYNENANGNEIRFQHSIYKNYTNTLEWIEKNGLSELFNKKYTIESIKLYKFDLQKDRKSINRFYNAEYNCDNNFSPMNEISSLYLVVNEVKYDEILSKARLSHFTDMGSDFAIITLINENGDTVITAKYLPQ